VNTIISVDTGTDTLTFTATAADSFAAGDYLVVRNIKAGGSYDWTLTAAQAARLELARQAGQGFSIRAGSIHGAVKSSGNTVNTVTGTNVLTFTASADADIEDNDCLVIDVSPLSTAADNNKWNLTAAQADRLTVGTTFKIVDPVNGIYGDADDTILLGTNTITAKSGNSISFTASSADTFDSNHYIVIETGVLNVGSNVWTLTPAQAARLEAARQAGQIFWIATGGPTGPLKTSINTVTSVSGTTLTFTATAANTYASADYIVVQSNPISTIGPNMWYFEDERQVNMLPVGTIFRTAVGSHTGALGGTVNVVTARDIANKTIAFTATALPGASTPYSFGPADYIVANTFREGIGIGHSGSTGSTILLIPEHAARFSEGDKFRIAQGSADGTLGSSVNEVTAVSSVPGAESITFTPAVGSYAADDCIVFIGAEFQTLPGIVEWTKSMAGGADNTLRGAADTLISSSGKTASSVFVGTGAYPDDGKYRVAGGSGLPGAGTTSLYPTSINDLLDRCFELYEGRTGTVLTSQRDTLGDIFTYQLWWWAGAEDIGALSQKTIGDFLSRDNGLNHGDLRYPFDSWPDKPRGADVGAYQN
jgi:hypothetical protein